MILRVEKRREGNWSFEGRNVGGWKRRLVILDLGVRCVMWKFRGFADVEIERG